MMMTIILLVCMYPFVFIMYLLLKNDAVPKKDIYYGINLDAEQALDPQVQSVLKKYSKQMKWCFFLMMVLPLLLLLIPWFSITMALWMVWILASIILFFVPYGIANTKLKSIKAAKGWKKTSNSHLYTEIKNAGQVRTIHFSQFVGPCILSIGTFILAIFMPDKDYQGAALIMIGSFAFITVLFYLTAVGMDRQKIRIVSTDSYININYAQARKNVWKNFWISCTWLNAVSTVGWFVNIRLDLHIFSFFLSEMIMYCIVIFLLIIISIRKLQEVETTYQDRIDYSLSEDEDFWIWGLIYYNPKDHHTMVEKRVGMGNSVNLATTGGKWFCAFLAAIMLGVIASSVWVIMLEFVPIRLTISRDMLVASQIRNDYVIAVDSIENLELLEDLPRWNRVKGTGMDNLEKGTFRIPEVGRCQVFVNPQNHLFIQFEANSTTYYMSGKDDEETRTVYDQLAAFSPEDKTIEYKAEVLSEQDFEVSYKGLVINSNTTEEDIIGTLGFNEDYYANNNGNISCGNGYRRWQVIYPDYDTSEVRIIYLSMQEVDEQGEEIHGDGYIVGVELLKIETNRGLKAGDTYEQALSLYGRPQSSVKEVDGDEELRITYEGQGGKIEIRVDKDNVIKSIFIDYEMDKADQDEGIME